MSGAVPLTIVTNWPIANVKPYDRNPRRNDQAVDAVARSIKEFGFNQPIVVDKDGVIIVGHTRWKAAMQLGLAEVPVHVADHLTQNQASAYRIADNKTAEIAEWDETLLIQELLALQNAGADMQSMGFADSELAMLLAPQPGEGLTDPDDVPSPPDDPTTKPGDLWLMGDHRLLCGDATSDKDVARLMGSARAGLMNTDPPFGVQYANNERPNPGVAKPRVAKPRVANDELSDEQLQQFLEQAFSAARKLALTDNAAWYMWHAHLTQGYFAAAAAAAADVVLHRQIIWVKNNMLLGRGHYHWKHEPCFMGWVKGKQPPDYGEGRGERTQTTVWEVPSISPNERREFNHSTPKPVRLFEIPIVKHLRAGEVCYEPFAGSGPQYIAAEQHGVACYGLEIDPAYCDVIVERWEKFTGKKAKRQASASGKAKRPTAVG